MKKSGGHVFEGMGDLSVEGATSPIKYAILMMSSKTSVNYTCKMTYKESLN
ncbi:MAG: hypothetical protein NTY22_04110 [Proteobacteria bacterium]|nr:hypothetical protein [Pseudomonadota bacterium]